MAEEEKRDVWGKQLEFIFTLIGYAVGLGNVWRFPYLCYKNGGGAFLIPYVTCLILLGIPIFALECAFGQYGGKGPLSIWAFNPLFKGLGLSMVLISAGIFIYYNVIIAQAIRFFVASMTSDLPWMGCDSCDCVLYNANLTATNDTNIINAELYSYRFNNSLGYDCPDITVDSTRSPSEIYYMDDILADTGTIEEIGGVRWELLVCNLVVYLIVFLVLVKGIASLGKMSYLTATFPYILLTIILVRVAMLDGAKNGVEFYLKPDWDKIGDASVWSDAATQIFFSLSCCQGGLVAMASYNKFSNNIIRDALMIPVINCLTSFYAGFVVFCTLGYMAFLKNESDVGKVVKQGPGLVFIVYPEAIGAMPVSTLWAVLFFFMLSVLGFSSQFSIAETLMTSIADEFRWLLGKSRMREVAMRFGVVIAGFVLGIPMCTQGGQHLLELVDSAVLGFPLMIVGLTEFLLIGRLYGYKQFAADIKLMVGFSPPLYFKLAWLYISPVVLTAVIVFTAYEKEDYDPAWSGLLYYLIIVFDLMWIPIGFFYYGRHAIKPAMKPQPYWLERAKLSEHYSPDLSPSKAENGMGGGGSEMTSKAQMPGQDNHAYVGGENGTSF